MNTQIVINKNNLAINENSSLRPPFMFKGEPLETKKTKEPYKLLIYGTNGMRKSIESARSKNPVFMNYDGNISHIEAHKKRIRNYPDTLEFINCLLNMEHKLNTCIVDPIGFVETQMKEHLKNTLSLKEKTYNFHSNFKQEVENFLSKLDLLVQHRKMNIILIGHSCIIPSNNPLAPYHERYDLRCEDKERFGKTIGDWVNGILFATHDVSFEETQQVGFKEIERVRADARRVFYTTPTPAYLAKNTWNLPPKIPMDWNEFINRVKAFYEAPGDTK